MEDVLNNYRKFIEKIKGFDLKDKEIKTIGMLGKIRRIIVICDAKGKDCVSISFDKNFCEIVDLDTKIKYVFFNGLEIEHANVFKVDEIDDTVAFDDVFGIMAIEDENSLLVSINKQENNDIIHMKYVTNDFSVDYISEDLVDKYYVQYNEEEEIEDPEIEEDGSGIEESLSEDVNDKSMALFFSDNNTRVEELYGEKAEEYSKKMGKIGIELVEESILVVKFLQALDEQLQSSHIANKNIEER